MAYKYLTRGVGIDALMGLPRRSCIRTKWRSEVCGARQIILTRFQNATRFGDELADHLRAGDIEHVDHVIVATGDVELAVIGVEMHVAPASEMGMSLTTLHDEAFYAFSER